MADNTMDAFLLYVDENQSVKEGLDERIMGYKGNPAFITRDVLIPYAAQYGFIITEEDVELYNGHENDGSEVPEHLRNS